jgi:hypothetical protein
VQHAVYVLSVEVRKGAYVADVLEPITSLGNVRTHRKPRHVMRNRGRASAYMRI